MKKNDLSDDVIDSLRKSRGKNRDQKDVFDWGNKLVYFNEDESLISWFLRQAWSFDTDVETLIKSERRFWNQHKSFEIKSWKRFSYWFERVDILGIESDLEKALELRGVQNLNSLKLEIHQFLDINDRDALMKPQLSKYYNYDLSFCQLCWSSDQDRYFRSYWRYSFVTHCTVHGIQLQDKCQICGNYLFSELRKLTLQDTLYCQHCGNEISTIAKKENRSLAKVQDKILSNILAGHFDATDPSTIFGIKYDEIPDKLIVSLNQTNVLHTTLGIELSKYHLLNFYEVNRDLPTARDNGMEKIRNATRSSEWKKSIDTWNSLLELVFGQTNIDYNKYTGKNGFQKAIEELRKFKQEFGRIPNSRDPQVKSISSLCTKGYWKEFGIESWNDILFHVFKDINTEPNQFLGKDGLTLAINKMKKFKTENNSLPKSNDPNFESIASAAKRGSWKEFHIESWNELLLSVFREVNHVAAKYTGKSGLKLAKQELKEFKNEFDRLPNSRDEDMSSIVYASSDGKYWDDFGISSWNDLLLSVFGQVNEEKNIWPGEKGLELAKSLAKKFHRDNDRFPNLTDKLGQRINGPIKRNYWEKFGINTWSDFTKYLFENSLQGDE